MQSSGTNLFGTEFFQAYFPSVAERAKAPFLRQPCDHDGVFLVQPHPRRIVAFLAEVLYGNYFARWFRTSSKLIGLKSKDQPESLDEQNVFGIH